MKNQTPFYDAPANAIVNITPITYETMWEFNKSVAKVKRRTVMYAVLSSVWAILLLLMIPLSFVSEQPNRWLILMGLFFLLLGIYMIVALNVLLPKQVRKHPLIGATTTYIFYEEGFSDETVSPNNRSQSQISYQSILMVKESQNYIYLFNQPNSAYIIQKSGFTSGSEAILKALLRAKIQPTKVHLQ